MPCCHQRFAENASGLEHMPSPRSMKSLKDCLAPVAVKEERL